MSQTIYVSIVFPRSGQERFLLLPAAFAMVEGVHAVEVRAKKEGRETRFAQNDADLRGASAVRATVISESAGGAGSERQAPGFRAESELRPIRARRLSIGVPPRLLVDYRNEARHFQPGA